MPQSILEGIACVLSEKVIPHSGVVYCQGDEVEDLYLIYKGGVKVSGLPDLLGSSRGHGATTALQCADCIRERPFHPTSGQFMKAVRTDLVWGTLKPRWASEWQGQ